MEDVLGIIDPVIQHKLRYEVNQVRDLKFKDINLYGYGANSFTQLGLFDKFASVPKKIPLPPLTYKDDYILRFACGRRNTAILTKKGELWITGNCKHDIDKKVRKVYEKEDDNENPESSDEDTKYSKKGGGRNKKGGKRGKGKKGKFREQEEDYDDYSEKIEENNKNKKKFRKTRHNANKMSRRIKYQREEKKKIFDIEKGMDHRFINFTRIFTKNNKKVPFKIDNIMLGIMDISVVMSYRNEKLEKVSSMEEKPAEKVKLCTVDKVLTQLRKSTKYDIDEFTIVYSDRFTGNVEVELRLFMECSDIPQHRIQKLCKNNEAYWDKVERIDKFKFN